ncbi:MAG: hypothetical protein WBP45_14690 [Daejeonella sp.]
MKDALMQMQDLLANGKPKPFSIAFVTADLNRDTGGEVIIYEKAILSRLRYERGNFKATADGHIKTPFHRKNRTRNICAVGTDEVRKLHIDLILEINGRSVA